MPEPVTLVAVGGGLVGLIGHLSRRYFDASKEAADIILGAVALVMALPVMAVCAAVIKLSGKGPVLFTQVREGKDGRQFRMYKLRTMHVGAEAGTGAVWARDRDPRVIPACRWMRRSHVDELPQIINVILGQMSLVGPRPERSEILDELQKTYPHVRQRLAVRPGITGLAQIRNGYDSTIEGFRHKLSADLEYIDERCWSNDLRIFAATVTRFHDRQAR